jgi:hypothetical protein
MLLAIAAMMLTARDVVLEMGFWDMSIMAIS